MNAAKSLKTGHDKLMEGTVEIHGSGMRQWLGHRNALCQRKRMRGRGRHMMLPRMKSG